MSRGAHVISQAGVQNEIMSKYLLAWCSDLHFDFIRPLQRQRFLDSVAMSGANGVVITGDISTSRRIADNLGSIAGTGLPTCFVTGNHDYYAGNFVATDAAIASVCRQFPNLTRLGLGEIIPLGERTVLIGHSGWSDGRAGMGPMTPVRMNDSLLIADLRLEGAALFEKLAELGIASARYLESVAAVAVQQADQVVVATHVPPFPEASRHEGAPGEPSHLPHFTNVAMGESLRKIARAWPRKKFMVICGHTHERFTWQAEENLVVKVAGARYGDPAVEEILEF
jgi:Icc-related predicted phosphoesterase